MIIFVGITRKTELFMNQFIRVFMVCVFFVSCQMTNLEASQSCSPQKDSRIGGVFNRQAKRTKEEPQKVERQSDEIEVRLQTDIVCRVVRHDKILATVNPGCDVVIRLKKGKHKLTFISNENETDQYSIVYTVGDADNRISINLAPIREERIERENMNENEIRVFRENDKYGFRYLDKVIIPAKFDRANGFKEGLAPVLLDDKWGFIDTNGNFVIPCQFDAALTFSEGLARVEQNSKCGYVDKQGHLVIPFKYEYAYSFTCGTTVVSIDGKYGFIDKTGKLYVMGEYDDLYSHYEEMAGVRKNGKYGYIDINGNLSIPLRYDAINHFGNGVAKVKQNGKWGYIDKKGRIVVPCKFDEIEYFSEGLVAVKSNGKWGYADSNGNLVIPCIYDKASAFVKGVAKVELNGQCGLVDKNGEFLLEN